MNALAQANRVRTANRLLIRALGAGSRTDGIEVVAGLLETGDPADAFGALSIWRLLTAVPRLGAVSANWFIRSAGLTSGDRRVRDLTARQRSHIAADLRVAVAEIMGRETRY